LLIQRLGHLGMGLGESPILLLQLREQAHVLNRDHCLVGEGLEEGDVLVGERSDFPAPEQQVADCLSVLQQRDSHNGASRVSMGQPEAFRELVGGRQDIRHVDRPTLDYGATADPTGYHPTDGIGPDSSVMRNQSNLITVSSVDKDVLGLAQLRRALGHRVQHGLKIGRRTANHSQDLCGCRLLAQGLVRLV